MNLLALGLDVTVDTLVKLTARTKNTTTKEHSHEQLEHSCEQFQHIKTILELYPDDDTKSNKPCIINNG